MAKFEIAFEQIHTAGDLTEEHLGWEIKVKEPEPLRRRYVTVSGLRKYEDIVFVTTTEGREKGFAGTERAYLQKTPCELVRPISRKAIQRAKSHPGVAAKEAQK